LELDDPFSLLQIYLLPILHGIFSAPWRTIYSLYPLFGKTSSQENNGFLPCPFRFDPPFVERDIVTEQVILIFSLHQPRRLGIRDHEAIR
jgi:hypothetical protein